jgi:ABC-2 type transport system permease protein
MNLRRVYAVMLRYFLLYLNGYGRIVDTLYWPLRDIILWGLTSVWIVKSQDAAPQIMISMVASIVLWHITVRATSAVGATVFEELASSNLVNLITTPLTLAEWIIGVMAMSAVIALCALVFGLFVAWALYGVAVLALGWTIFPLMASLLIFGWSLGFLSAACLISWGIKVQAFTFIIAWFAAPFIGIFTPLNLLPGWALTIARGLPLSYVFEALRSLITTGKLPWRDVAISFGLNSVYLIVALATFIYAFEKSRNKGLSRLE